MKTAGNMEDIIGESSEEEEGRPDMSLGLPQSRQTIGAPPGRTSAGTVLRSTVVQYWRAVGLLKEDLEEADDPVEKARLTGQIEEIRREIDRLHSPSGALKTIPDKRRSRINAINQAIKRVYKSIPLACRGGLVGTFRADRRQALSADDHHALRTGNP
ncbi:MAG: hypothetical protein ABIP48_12420 [Planctomycetota bacterium]